MILLYGILLISVSSMLDVKINMVLADTRGETEDEDPLVKVIGPTPPPQEKFCNSVCSSPICVEEASFFTSIMKQELDPCNDFYQFVCGNFLNKTIPEGKSSISTLGTIQDKLKIDILKEIKTDIKATDSQTYKKIKTYYQNCANESRIEEEGLKPFLEIIERLGNWPILHGNDWNESNYNWEDTLSTISNLGFKITFPFTLGVGVDSNNTKMHTIMLYPTFTRIKESYFSENNKTLIAYFDYIVDIAIELGANKETAIEHVKEIIDFETKLFKIQTSPQESQNDSTYNDTMTVDDLSQKYPDIPWLKVLNVIFNPINIQISENETVTVLDLKYFSKLKNLLKDTPKKVLANYQIWQIISRMVYYMPSKLDDRELAFLNVTYGTINKPDRETRCVYEVIRTFGVGVSAMYVNKYFKKETIRNVTKLAYSIKYQLKTKLKTIGWMDVETRKHALEKLDSMGIFIGYPSILLRKRLINEHYKDLKINPGNYLNTIINTIKYLRNKSYHDLRKPIVDSRWLFRTAVVVNAFYSFSKNAIEVPAGILQDPIFELERPEYLNYGAVGSIIGHEITHGFDGNGREFDKKGNHANWWSSYTEEQFIQKTKCLIEKYNNYTISDIGSINGNLTLNENIADIGGIKWAYQAYERWIHQHQVTESCLPGLHYTPHQMFWISAASIWCEKRKDEALKKLINNYNHSPSSARVMIPFSNTKEFAKDFNCKIGTTMNPENKCDLW